MPKAFEIIYDDFTVVSGTTAAEFDSAESLGIQIVIVEHDNECVEQLRALDEYEYDGITKLGSWTDDATFQAVKDRVVELSNLLTTAAVKTKCVRNIERNR